MARLPHSPKRIVTEPSHGKDQVVIHGTPAQSAGRAAVAPTERAPRKRGNRRKLVAAFVLVGLVVLAAVGYQAYKVVDAISQAEDAAVVPWPTRDPSLAVAAAPSRTPSALPTKTPVVVEPTPPAVTNVQVQPSRQSGTVAAVAPKPTLPPEPTATAKPAAPTAAASAPAAHSPTPTPPLASASGSSGFGVLGDIIGAGTQGGDPGRSEIWGGRTELNILVVGIDRRANGGDQNADVLIIARLDLVNKRVAAVSLPRDLLVEIPGVGADKINGSYNYGVLADPSNPAAGVAKVRDTIEALYGIMLDGYVLVDFNGFEDVIDAVGGVTVDVPKKIVDNEYPTADYGTEVVTFDPGIQTMDGETALKYVRTRHADSDDSRRERQYQVLLALFQQGKSFSSVTKADNVILALGGSVQTSFNLEQQLTLARIGMAIDQSEIELSVLGPPILQPGYTDAGAWVYIGDPAQVYQYIQDALSTDFAPNPAGPVISTPTGS